jgi:hypothetical protein
MKKIQFFAFAIMLIILSAFVAYTDNSEPDYKTFAPPPQAYGQIYLYGEQHGERKIMDKEFELWHGYYNDGNMRHLFVELPYYTADFLNIWMQSGSDDILDELYNDLVGTDLYVPYTKDFYKMIKRECPKTIFHGTDVGHQYNTTGERYLKYLETNNLKDSGQYLLTKEAIEQGKYYYGNNGNDRVYRENKMAENFIREFDKLNDESIMGIYGGAHTGLDAMDSTGSVPCMANQLKNRYGKSVHSENLHWVMKDIEPSKTDTIAVAGKEYKAAYFGTQDLTSFNLNYTSRKFWRLENAYDDFKDKSKLNDVLPYNNYPMLIETGQVFVIDYTKKDGSVERMYYISNGNKWNNLPVTDKIKAE